MAKYLLLYRGGSMPETEAETAKVIQAWTDWYSGLGSAVVDPGYPFSPAAKTIASNGGVGIPSANEMASGYTILEANALDDAVNKAKGCPVLHGGGSIVVFETFNVMG